MVRSTTNCDFHRNKRTLHQQKFPNGNQNVCACLCVKTLKVYGILNIKIIIFLTINFQRRESLTKIIIVFMEFQYSFAIISMVHGCSFVLALG